MGLSSAVYVLGFLLASVHARSGSAQTPAAPESRSVWDGVYAETQAQRGEALYHEDCSSCHGDKLAGKRDEDIPALTGHDFSVNWNGRTLAALFKKIIRTMPQDDPGRLTPQQCSDAIAFILSVNKFPSGDSELSSDDAILSTIVIETEKPKKGFAP